MAVTRGNTNEIFGTARLGGYPAACGVAAASRRYAACGLYAAAWARRGHGAALTSRRRPGPAPAAEVIATDRGTLNSHDPSHNRRDDWQARLKVAGPHASAREGSALPDG